MDLLALLLTFWRFTVYLKYFTLEVLHAVQSDQKLKAAEKPALFPSIKSCITSEIEAQGWNQVFAPSMLESSSPE